MGHEAVWSIEGAAGEHLGAWPASPVFEPGERAKSSPRPKAPAGLTRRDFFADVVVRLRALLPEELAAFEHRATINLVKLFYGNERIHYEVWTDGARGQIEIGLHFEDGPLSTASYLVHFDRHIVELKHALGPQIELERWTSSWGHLYELVPLSTLTAATVERTARRLAEMVTTLQPLVEAAGVAPERAVQAQAPGSRGPWRRWRRGGG